MTHTSHPELNACELYEAELSAVLDGELDLVDLPATLDHLIDCPRCAAFYRSSRLLGHAVSSSRAELSSRAEESFRIEPHESLWRRISERAPWTETSEASERTDRVATRQQTPKPLPRRSRRSRLQEWAPRLAAVLVLAFGLWMVQVTSRDGGSAFLRSGGEVGEGATMPEAMSEQRFVALATEVLRADPKYHHEMLEVMESATRAEHRESTVDYRRTEEGLGLLGRTRGEGDLTTDGRLWK